jgi:hypothetical protein
MERAFQLIANLPEDMFADERVDLPPQSREGL